MRLLGIRSLGLSVLTYCVLVLSVSTIRLLADSESLLIDGTVESLREIPGRTELAVLVDGAQTRDALLVDVAGKRIGGAAELEGKEPRWIYAADIDGDERAEIVIGTRTKIFAFDIEDGLVLAPGAAVEMPPRRSYPLSLSDGRLGVVTLGSVRRVNRPAESEQLVLDDFVELPRRATRTSRGFRMTSPPIAWLELEMARFAVGPEENGPRRLLTSLIDDQESIEVWSLLPAPESVAQSWYEVLDGRPALVVTTVPSEKLGIFVKLGLRVFPLVAGRTRSGRGASLTIDTVTRRWYEVGVEVFDADRDGKDDLIVIQPEGLGAGKLFVDLYSGKGNLGFKATPRRSKLEYGEIDYLYGADVDGDGVPDLALLADNALVVHRGLAEHRKLVVEKTPNWRVDLATPIEREKRIEIEIGDDPEGDDWHGYEVAHLRQVGHIAGGRAKLLVVRTDDQETMLHLVDFP